MKYGFYSLLFTVNIASIIFIYVKVSYFPNIKFYLNGDTKDTINNFVIVNEFSPMNLSTINSDKPKDKPPPYRDMKFLSNCQLTRNRDEFYFLLKWWIDFAAEHDIVWWLRDGTLIGAQRHGDIVPWDQDMDIAILSQYESLIRNLSQPHNATKKASKDVQIISRMGEHCVWTPAPRYSCQGKVVNSQVDSCAFCGPLARVTRDISIRLDLYLSSLDFSEGSLKVFDESHFEYMKNKPLYPLDWVFPLKSCQIMNLTVLCPNKASTYLTNYYGGFSSRYHCKNKEWVKI